MNRNEIVRQLHLIIDARLFGAAGWPVDRESANRLQTTLMQMGLVEEVPGKADTWRNTPLGNELHLVLPEVFMGFWDEWEVPEILEEYGDPPPLKWSDLRYVFDIQEDCNGKEAIQA
jgi:hypothetical protein